MLLQIEIVVKGPLHPNSSKVVNMYWYYATSKSFRTLPKTFESFAKAFAGRKLLEVALFLGC